MNRPTVGLALGSGSARGFAHLGVIKVFEEEGIPIDYIAGSSMGALVAALYTAGQNIDDLYKLSTGFRRKYFIDVTVPKMGFISGNKIKEFIKLFTYHKNIEDLAIPTAIVATDLQKGEKVVFTKGSIADAVRASISIPGVFVPERIDGRLLVDGGVIDRVPVSVVKDLGADIVVAVDVSEVNKNIEIQTIYDVIMQSIDILQVEIIENREIESDVMIRPHLVEFNARSFTDIEAMIRVGEEEARKHIDKIRSLLE
ncbi:esterase [Bacillus coahuilensis p1.1.43]|uniref:Esterase n=1 Tax=Bacillus coahuilensis p1.1.43 TaxID=1150625 RepID=A0A147KA23_9BACI|nr:patatin-like phospholipase family protein [Bacillus coahuilensis]KUP07323.1 esterase [Bacillus coahuilensis p1.1.43]